MKAGMVRRFGAGGEVSFSPDDIAGLELWLKADTLVLSDNDPVATWTDSSGNGNDVTQGTAGTRPLYKTAIQNGLPVVRFDGTDDYMIHTTLNVSQPGTVFIVGKTLAGEGNTRFMDGETTGTDRWIFGTSSTNADYQIYAGTSVDTGTPDTAFHYFTVVFNGASSAGWVDAVSLFASNLGAQNLASGITVGAGQNGDENLTGDIGELLLYDSELSAPDRASVEAYLAAKWGL
jgi:hypothetical protein